MNESNEYFVEIFCEVSAEILSRESVMNFFSSTTSVVVRLYYVNKQRWLQARRAAVTWATVKVKVRQATT